MNYLKLLIAISFLMALVSCGDNESEVMSGSDELIIGVYYGECFGDCARFYKLQNDMIYPDAMNNGYSDSLIFNDIALEVSKDILASFTELESNIPSILLEDDKAIYGCPDCGDWGAIGFIYDDRRWTLDNALDNNPDEIKDFVEDIQTILEDLRE